MGCLSQTANISPSLREVSAAVILKNGKWVTLKVTDQQRTRGRFGCWKRKSKRNTSSCIRKENSLKALSVSHICSLDFSGNLSIFYTPTGSVLLALHYSLFSCQQRGIYGVSFNSLAVTYISYGCFKEQLKCCISAPALKQ